MSGYGFYFTEIISVDISAKCIGVHFGFFWVSILSDLYDAQTAPILSQTILAHPDGLPEEPLPFSGLSRKVYK